jgi:hypothetical protein
MKKLVPLFTLFLLVCTSVRAQTDTLACDKTITLERTFKPCCENVEALRPHFNLLQPVVYSFTVLNRWGELLFETKKATEGWDGRDKKGRLMTTGQYNWVMDYRYPGDTARQCKGILYLIC